MTSTTASARRISLELIDVGDNVRELDQAHVDALAASIQLQGILVPLVVQAAGEDDGVHSYDLVAGFHRYAAATKLGLHEVPVVLRGEHDDHGVGVAADRATENITSCRRRHEAINADRVVMPMSELKAPGSL
jgi:ParB family chromosome partitioning protein